MILQAREYYTKMNTIIYNSFNNKYVALKGYQFYSYVLTCENIRSKSSSVSRSGPDASSATHTGLSLFKSQIPFASVEHIGSHLSSSIHGTMPSLTHVVSASLP